MVETVKEIVIEKPKPMPVPVIVKTIHDQIIVTEDPTDIHHVELAALPPVVRSAPPPPVVKVKQEVAKGFKWRWIAIL